MSTVDRVRKYIPDVIEEDARVLHDINKNEWNEWIEYARIHYSGVTWEFRYNERSGDMRIVYSADGTGNTHVFRVPSELGFKGAMTSLFRICEEGM